MNDTPKPGAGQPAGWQDEETGRQVRRVTPASLLAAGLYHHLRAFTEDRARFAPDGKGVFRNGAVERVPAVFRVDV